MDQKQAKPRVVFVGAGQIGAEVILAAAKQLPNAELTVVDTRNYFENNIGAVRSIVLAGFLNRTTKPHSEWLPKNVKLVVGRVAEVTKEKTLRLVSGDTIPFDFLVLQTGSNYNLFKPNAASIDGRKEEIVAQIARIKEAKHILIAGGGYVGCETAAEIVSVYPDKKVTIVHSHDRLVNVAAAKMNNKVLPWLKTHKVTVVLDDRLVLEDRKLGWQQGDQKGEAPSDMKMKTYKTAKGATIEADLLLDCCGMSINSQYMEANFAGVLTSSRRIRVNNAFVVDGTNNMFALGDVCDRDPVLTAANGIEHVPIVVPNLVATVNANGKSQPSLKQYKGAKFPWGPACSMGPDHTFLAIPCCCGCVLSFDLGAKKTEFMVKLPMPPAA